MPDIIQAIGLSPDETVAYFRAKGYQTQAHWDELWQQEHARAFTVTKMLDGDLLAKVRASLDDVLAKGGTFEQWQAAIVPQMKAAGWYSKVEDVERTGVATPVFIGEARLRTIYDTNLRTARAAGRWQRIQATKAFQPYLMYDAVHDNRTRPLHRLWGGLDDGKPIILPVDHPAWLIYFPPCGWGCRCGVIQLSLRDIQRRGLSVTTDAELMAKGWMTADGQVGGNRKAYQRTDGSIEKVPAGIDPGFAYNPGEEFLRALAPPPLSGPIDSPHIVMPAGTPPFPAPTAMLATTLLAPDTPVAATMDRFMSNFDAQTDGRTMAAVDRVGQPIVVDETFFHRDRSIEAQTGTPAGDPDRVPYANLFAATLKDPDEIWWRWEPWTDQKGKTAQRLVRRYLARYSIEGADQNILLSMTYGQGGWSGLAADIFTDLSDLATDALRGGVLAYRR